MRPEALTPAELKCAEAHSRIYAQMDSAIEELLAEDENMRHDSLSPAELKARLHKLQVQASGIRDQAELDRILLSFPGARAEALAALRCLPKTCGTCRREHRGLTFEVKDAG